MYTLIILESLDRFRQAWVVFHFTINAQVGYSHIVWVCVSAGFAKVLPFTSKSKFCKFGDAIPEHPFNLLQVITSFVRLAIPLNGTLSLDQFSMITRPYPRADDLKITPFPAFHTRIANIREYSLPPKGTNDENKNKSSNYLFIYFQNNNSGK